MLQPYCNTNIQKQRQRQALWDRVKVQDLLFTALLLLVALLWQSKANANQDEVYSSLSEIGTGALVAKGDQGYVGLVRLGNDIQLNVAGMLVHANIQQRFKNDSQEWIEATYVFPLPSESAVNSMRIKIGERVIEGVIKERQEARKIFVKAKREGKQTGLLEQQRPNLFTTRVANIGPGETIVVEFSYLQTLRYVDNEFSLRVPLTLTPRYIPGNPQAQNLHGDDSPIQPALSVNGWSFPTDQVPDANEITPPQITHPYAADSHVANLEIQLSPGFDLAAVNSPYHDISTQRQSADYHIYPKQNPVVMNRDFVLSWKPVAQQAPLAAVFQESNHALLMVMPPVNAKTDVVPPRELIIIIDTSGSMAGDSIVQARQAVLMALDRLRPQDHFNVIEFNSTHRALFAQSQPAQRVALDQARAFVRGLRANGGTEMYGALNAALQFPYLESHLRQVVFITDGSVGNESALFGLIHQSLGKSRLYTVGIGSAPNEFFMRKAAEFGKGTFSMIGSHQEVQQKMSSLFSKIEKPVMTNLQVTAKGAKAELFPGVIPDLYQGEPLILNAKFDQWPKQLSIEGEFNGQRWQQDIRLSSQQDTTGVATLWAREKVQHLEDEAIKQGQRDLFKQEITQLGLEYGIVTRFTSFVAVAKVAVRPLTESVKSKAVPNLMPAGSKQQPPSVGMPRTALGVKQMLIMGLASLLAALAIWWLQYNRHLTAIRSMLQGGA